MANVGSHEVAPPAERPAGPSPSSVLVASNRGPVSFRQDDEGRLEVHRGGGGLVSGLVSLKSSPTTLWVCAALSEADRHAARQSPRGHLDASGHDTNGMRVRMLDIPPGTFARAYNVVANSVLWFVHHLMYDTATEPVFDARFAPQWRAYLDYNERFAAALAEESAPHARVFVQDYHLTLTPRLLRQRRPDLRVAHFSHTPWAPPDYFRVLPDDVARDVLLGVLGADVAGFLTARWARAFAACCRDVLGAEVREAAPVASASSGPDAGQPELRVTVGGRTTRVTVHPLGVDSQTLHTRAAQPDVRARGRALAATVGERKVILRVDRTELSKNIVRGLMAYRELLRRYPQWRERVVHVAFAYPSRHDLPVYRAYTGAVQKLAQEILDEFETPSWHPLVLHIEDDFPRTLAAYQRADVLLVNPIRDGMNLVAKEAPVLSRDGVALVLSREAGAVEELGADALVVNPFDVVATADALHAALSMDPDERRERSQRLAAAATRMPPSVWFADQMAALDAEQ